MGLGSCFTREAKQFQKSACIQPILSRYALQVCHERSLKLRGHSAIGGSRVRQLTHRQCRDAPIGHADDCMTSCSPLIQLMLPCTSSSIQGACIFIAYDWLPIIWRIRQRALNARLTNERPLQDNVDLHAGPPSSQPDVATRSMELTTVTPTASRPTRLSQVSSCLYPTNARPADSAGTMVHVLHSEVSSQGHQLCTMIPH